jgi:hypothetical protein
MPLTLLDTAGRVRELDGKGIEKRALYKLKKQYFKHVDNKGNPDFFELKTKIDGKDVRLRVVRSATKLANPLEFQMQGYIDSSKYKTFLTPLEVDVFDKAKQCWRMATETEEAGYHAMKKAYASSSTKILVHGGFVFRVVDECIFCGGNFMVCKKSRKLPTAFIGVEVTVGGVAGCLVVRNRVSKKWMMPGGLVDSSDPSLFAAARRELFEESGLTVETATVQNQNFFILRTRTPQSMTDTIFEKRSDPKETDDYGVAYSVHGQFTVATSNGRTSTDFRGGTVKQLKAFFGQAVALGFADRTLVGN